MYVTAVASDQCRACGSLGPPPATGVAPADPLFGSIYLGILLFRVKGPGARHGESRHMTHTVDRTRSGSPRVARCGCSLLTAEVTSALDAPTVACGPCHSTLDWTALQRTRLRLGRGCDKVSLVLYPFRLPLTPLVAQPLGTLARAHCGEFKVDWST